MLLTSQNTHNSNIQVQIVGNQYLSIHQAVLHGVDLNLKVAMYNDVPLEVVKDNIKNSLDSWFSLTDTICTMDRSCVGMEKFKLICGDLNTLLDAQFEFLRHACAIDEIKGFYVAFNNSICNIWININSEDIEVEDAVYKIFNKYRHDSFNIMMFRDYEITDVEKIGYTISLKRIGEN